MPAAAVIPAPGRHIKVVAVKKLVVECLGRFLESEEGEGGKPCLLTLFSAPLSHTAEMVSGIHLSGIYKTPPPSL